MAMRDDARLDAKDRVTSGDALGDASGKSPAAQTASAGPDATAESATGEDEAASKTDESQPIDTAEPCDSDAEAAERAYASLDLAPAAEDPAHDDAGASGDVPDSPALVDADAWDEGSRPDDTYWDEGTDWTAPAQPLSGEDTLARDQDEDNPDAHTPAHDEGALAHKKSEGAGVSDGASEHAEAGGHTGSAEAAPSEGPSFSPSGEDDDPWGARAALDSLGGPRPEETRVLSAGDARRRPGGSGLHEAGTSAADSGKPAASDGEGFSGGVATNSSAATEPPAAGRPSHDAAADSSASPAAGRDTASPAGAPIDLGETRPGGIPVDETTVIPHASDRPDSSRKARRAAKYYYPKYYQPSRFGRVPYVVAIVVLAVAVVCLGISTAWYSGAITRYTGYGRQSAGIFTDTATNDQRFVGKLAIAQGSDGTTFQNLLYLDAQANGDATAFYRGTLLAGRLVQVASDQDTVTYQLQGTATQGGDTVTNATLTLCLPLGLTAENLAGTWRTSLVTADQTLSNWGTIKDDGTATANATDKYDIFNPGDKSTRESYTYTWSTADDGKVTLAPNRASSYFTLKVWM